MTAADRAMAQLESWPNLVSGSPRCAVGRAFGTAGDEIVHFHSNDAADLHLTRAAIERLLPHLRLSTAIRVRPGASWITVLLDCDADIALLLTLVSVALKEHGAAHSGRATPPCDWELPAIPSLHTAASPGPVAPDPAHRGMPSVWKTVGRLIPHGH
ncbi:luciferase domain-containing protein [Streptomyces inhibens]|uniref:luciferase domain-containing protein n=1 Tax=Streptomyces inhibens TaxID=2293571 RepID=UPI00402AEE3D